MSSWCGYGGSKIQWLYWFYQLQISMTCLTIGNHGNPGNPGESWESWESMGRSSQRWWRSLHQKNRPKKQLRVEGFFYRICHHTFFLWTVSSINHTFPNWIQLSYYPCLYNHPVGWVLCLRSSGNFVIDKLVGKVPRLELDELNLEDGSLFQNPWGWGPLNSSTKKEASFQTAGLLFILRAIWEPPSLQMGSFWC